MFKSLAARRLGEPFGLILSGTPQVVNHGSLQIGRNFYLGSEPVISHLVTEKTGAIVIGDHVSVGYGAAIFAEKEIRIGNGVRIAPYCVIADTSFHVIGDANRRPEPRAITIGNQVSIGAKVNILPGTTIGDGVVVLAGSTVSGKIADGVVVGGVPAVVCDREYRSSL